MTPSIQAKPPSLAELSPSKARDTLTAYFKERIASMKATRDGLPLTEENYMAIQLEAAKAYVNDNWAAQQIRPCLAAARFDELP